MTDEARARRIARNEAAFRAINERLEADLRSLAPAPQERFAFVCECAQAECADPVSLSFAEYQAVRRDAHRFAVAPGHVIDDVESVVARHANCWVVEKRHPAAEAIVEATDPRG